MQRHIPVSVSLMILLMMTVGGIFMYLPYALWYEQRQPVQKRVQRHIAGERLEFIQRIQSTSPHRASTKTNPWGIALDEQRGFVWVAEPGCDMAPLCQSAFPAYLGKYALADGSLIATYPEPVIEGSVAYSSPLFVQVSPDGHVWFTEPNSNAIAEFDPDERRFLQWKTTPGSAPYDLIFDANGNLWFTELTGNSIGFFNTRTYHVTETPLSTPDSRPYGITLDHQGHIWFAENRQGQEQIGTFTPTLSGQISITEYPIDTAPGARPHLITTTQHDDIWISEGFSGTLARFSPATRKVTRYSVALPCRRANNCTHISGITADAQNRIWFTDSLNATVGYLIPNSGAIRARLIKDPAAHPHDGLTLQSNGTVWFTEQYGEQHFGPALVMCPGGVLP